MSSYWRERARPIIAEVLRETEGLPEKEIRQALTAAYPFGERRMWPYKVYLSEVRRQRELGKPHGKAIQKDASQLRLLDLDGSD